MKRILAPLAPLVLVALVVAGCSDTPEPDAPAPAPTTETTEAPPIRALTPSGRTVPVAIDASGTSDVSAAMASFVKSVPDGSTITFPAKGRYRMESTLLLENRNDLTLEGNGATIFATTTGARERAAFRAVGGTNLTFRNFTIRGANPDAGADGTFVVALEAQHGFDALGVHGLTIEGNTVSDIYGDFVHLGRMWHRPPGVPAINRWTENAVIRGNKFERSGRQAVTFFAARDVLVEDNDIASARRSTFDFEPGGDLYGAERVVIRNNRIGKGRLNFVAAAGHGPVNDITVTGNTLTGQALQFYIVDKQGARRHNWTITNNTSDTTNFSAPHKSVMRIWRVDNLEIHGNRMKFNPKSSMYGVGLTDACNADVSGNHFTGTLADSFELAPCSNPSTK